MGQAKQIIFYDDKDNKWKLNEMDSKNELEKILNQEHVRGLPIAILSVIGAFRTGKSFLLSWLLCYFKAHLRVKNASHIVKFIKLFDFLLIIHRYYFYIIVLIKLIDSIIMHGYFYIEL